MAVPFSNTKLRVPKGFQNVLEAFAREVLRSQPENILEFAAAYFENMLKVRAETGHDPAVHGARLEDRNYNNEGFKKRAADPGEQQQQQQAAVTVQTQYRQHAAKQEVEELKAEEAAIKIQAGFRGFIDRENLRKMKNEPSKEKGSHHKDQDHKDQDHKDQDHKDHDLTDPALQEAAVKVHSGIKGYKARQEVQGSEVTEEQKKRLSQDVHRRHSLKEEKAATKIQAEFKGFKARKEFKHKKEEHEKKKKMEELKPPEAEEVIDIDLADPEVAKAAVKIQASFKNLKLKKQKLTDSAASVTESGSQQAPDPSHTQHHAATKIQAGFRGYKTRKVYKSKDSGSKHDGADMNTNNNSSVDIEDPEVEMAAVRIQAGFKGMKARREIKNKMAERKREEGGSLEEGEDFPAPPSFIELTQEEAEEEGVNDEEDGMTEREEGGDGEGRETGVEGGEGETEEVKEEEETAEGEEVVEVEENSGHIEEKTGGEEEQHTAHESGETEGEEEPEKDVGEEKDAEESKDEHAANESESLFD